MSENDMQAIEGEIVPAQQTGLSLGSLPMANPTEIVQRATEVAKVLTKVIKDQHLSKNIQGREYVYVTGWSTLGAMLGIMARETPGGTYAREDGSYVGSVDLIRVSDGMVIGGGTAVVGMDERDAKGTQTWGSRPEYARRSMAVTRAAGKAYRLTLAWIMALAGFEGTPAEEMDGLNLQNDDSDYSKPRPKAAQKPQDAASALPRREAVSASAGLAFPPFDAVIAELDGKSLYMLQNEGWQHVGLDNAFHYKNRWKKVYGVSNIKDIPGTVGEFIERMKRPTDEVPTADDGTSGYEDENEPTPDNQYGG